MRKRKYGTLLFFLLCGLVMATTAYARVSSSGYAIDWVVVGGGAGPAMSGGGHRINGTLGQTTTGWSENGHRLGSGFWYGLMEVEYRIFLPLVLRQCP